MDQVKDITANVSGFLQDIVKFFESIVNFIKEFIGWNGEGPTGDPIIKD